MAKLVVNMERMDSRLFEIANRLTLSLHSIDDIGLIGGKMGAVLFYYEFSRYTGIKTYEDMADDLLDEVLSNTEKLETGSIERGVAGVGWGINYLIRNSFVEANDDILVDLETCLFAKDYVCFDTHFSTLSPAIYLLSRPEEKYKLDKYDSWVVALLNSCTYYCLNIYDNKKKPLDLINSMLYFLIGLKNRNIHTWEASKLIWKILNYLLGYKNMADDLYGDSIILLSLLKQLDDSTPLKKEVLARLEKINDKSWGIETYNKIGWQQILFSCSIEKSMAMPDINKLLYSKNNRSDVLIPWGLYLMNMLRQNEYE